MMNNNYDSYRAAAQDSTMTQGVHLVRRVITAALLVMALITGIVSLVQLGSIMSTGLLSNV